VNCHCDKCKRHSGSPFSTYAVLPFKDLEICKGAEHIGEYLAGTGKKRFCKNCGTPLFNTSENYPGACMVYLGTLSAPGKLTPKVNIWCDSQLEWVNKLSEILSLPQGIVRKNT
jgi:hypothetical protein